MSTPPGDDTDAHAREDQQIQQLQDRLDRVPPPLQPLDVSALDGFMCAVLLQPEPVPARDWQRWIIDVDGRAPAPGFDAGPIHRALQRRHNALQRAIAQRQWFDPWIFELDGAATVSESVLPWVAGFAAALERFPALERLDDARLLEPLALLYMHFDADDLEDADALQQLIDTLEPPPDLAEAVQDVVRSVMLLADVTQPLPPAAPAGRPSRAPRRR